MEAPNKIYLEKSLSFPDKFHSHWYKEDVVGNGVEYVSKDLLLEWLAERKKYYQGLIPAEGAVAFICALDEVKHKIESI